AVASAREGPVVVARLAAPGRPKSAVIGFDPFEKTLRLQLATPLLLANLLHWLAPGAFGVTEAEAAPNDFVSAHIAHSLASGERVVYSDLPGVAEFRWTPPPGTATGLPARRVFAQKSDTLWKWFAALAAILLALEWLFFGRSKRAYGRLAVKVASFAAIAWALAMPAIQARASKIAAAVLVDTSASIKPGELARASSIATAIARNQGGNWTRVIPFASGVQNMQSGGIRTGSPLENASGSDANATNLETALLAGAVSLPDGYVPRLVLLSDGFENEGSAARAIAELAALHVRVDTIPLIAGSGSALRVMSVSMPSEAYAGERIPIEVHVRARAGGRGKVDLRANGRPLGGQAIDLAPGTNDISVQARVNSTGVAAISGRISEGASEASFVRALSLRRGRVLYISGDLPESGGNLISALQASGLEVTRETPLLAPALSGVQLVVLNNIDFAAFTPIEKTQLEDYVKGGGGLLLIGGGREMYRAHRQMDALDRVLPAKVAPPKGADGTAVALIIDKSSSMEGRKIQLARLSAIGVVNHLRPTDTIGVLMFDNSYQWAVSMRRAGDKPRIDRSIAGITPDGGTQIAPALGEAYRKLLASKAAYKHIVLLTDGISEAGDSFDLARNALAHHVTISTVGLGLDVNRSYLEKVAAISGGHSYFLNQPGGLQQIVLKDVRNFTGSSTVEKPLEPIVERQAQILDGVGMKSAPPLKGYTRFLAKPDAETILSIGPVKKDPLYVEWQYGLGRAAVFASDAKSRWADSWITWPGFDKFWINVSRELLKQPENGAQAAFDSANGDVVVRYRVPPNVSEPAAPPEIFAIGPGGFEKPVAIEKAAPRLYYGRVHIGNTRGLIRIRPVADSAAFPETGVYQGSREANDYGTNEPLLRQIAARTGGRYDPLPNSLFNPDGRFVYRRLELWPGLLAVAIALGIAELLARKWGMLNPSRKHKRPPRAESSGLTAPRN
ncbi:MAG: VWA domain-containing protein, partial [Bryobacteraceae bacterium]